MVLDLTNVNWPDVILGSLAGLLLSVMAAIVFWFFHKPKLQTFLLSDTYDNSSGNKNGSWVRLGIKNLSQLRLLSWIGRASAVGCQGHIRFYTLTPGVQEMFPSSPMKIKWTLAGDPASLVSDQSGTRLEVDESKFDQSSVRELHPGIQEFIDIAVRFDNEQDSYGWANSSYLSPTRHSEWRLPSGQWLVRVDVTGVGTVKLTEVFLLINSGNRQDMRLVHPTKQQKEQVLSI